MLFNIYKKPVPPDTVRIPSIQKNKSQSAGEDCCGDNLASAEVFQFE
jgi:hypothetical protein